MAFFPPPNTLSSFDAPLLPVRYCKTEDAAVAKNEDPAPVSTAASNSNISGQISEGKLPSVAQGENGAQGATPPLENGQQGRMENDSSTLAPGDAAVNGGSINNDHTASNGNGTTTTVDGASGDGSKKENGQVESKEEGAVEDDGEDMDIEPPPKPDPMVDYTDEFGRVRTMLQRCVQRAACSIKLFLTMCMQRHDFTVVLVHTW